MLRRVLLAFFLLLTVALVYSATQLRVDAGFSKMVPLEHEYMRTFTEYQKTFGGANRVLVALRVKGAGGDIYTPEFMRALKGATDDVFFIPGVDRATVTSLFTPNVRFIEVVEEGFAGGNVVPATFRGTPSDLEIVRQNVLKSGNVGRLVANDFRGALIRAELLEVDPASGQRLNYRAVARTARSGARQVPERPDRRAHHRLREGGRRHHRRRHRRARVLRHRLRHHGHPAVPLQGLAAAHRPCARLRADAGRLAARIAADCSVTASIRCRFSCRS